MRKGVVRGGRWKEGDGEKRGATTTSRIRSEWSHCMDTGLP